MEAGAECAGLGVSCATGFVPHPRIAAAGRDGGAGKRSSSFQKTPFVFSLAAASRHSREEEDGEGSQQVWVGKGWQISPPGPP